MTHPVYKSLIAWLAMTLVLTDVTVRILSPEQIDISSSIPVLCCKSYARTTMRLKKGAIYKIVGIDYAFGQSACHLAVIYRVDYLFWIVLALLATIATQIVDKHHMGELTVYLIIYRVCYSATGFAERNVLLANATIANQRAH